MDRNELIQALAGRLGDRRSAAEALDAVLAEIQSAVARGDKVSITGFGVFEKEARAARTGRNPRTGETIKIPKTSTPAFRAGTSFKDMVATGRVTAGGGSGIAKAKRTAATKKGTRAKKSAPAKKALAAPPPGPDFDTGR